MKVSAYVAGRGGPRLALDWNSLPPGNVLLSGGLTREILAAFRLHAKPPTTHHLEGLHDRDHHGSNGRRFRNGNRD